MASVFSEMISYTWLNAASCVRNNRIISPSDGGTEVPQPAANRLARSKTIARVLIYD